MVDHVPSKLEALSSNPSTTEKQPNKTHQHQQKHPIASLFSFRLCGFGQV
jgi:hypothetical protein